MPEITIHDVLLVCKIDILSCNLHLLIAYVLQLNAKVMALFLCICLTLSPTLTRV